MLKCVSKVIHDRKKVSYGTPPLSHVLTVNRKSRAIAFPEQRFLGDVQLTRCHLSSEDLRHSSSDFLPNVAPFGTRASCCFFDLSCPYLELFVPDTVRSLCEICVEIAQQLASLSGIFDILDISNVVTLCQSGRPGLCREPGIALFRAQQS